MKKYNVLFFFVFIFLITSSFVSASSITPFNSPYESCLGSYQNHKISNEDYFKLISNLSAEDRMIVYNNMKQYQNFEREYFESGSQQSFNQEILCQYNGNIENCKQCIASKEAENKWNKTKQQIISYSIEGLLLLLTGGLFYFLIRIVRKPEVNHKALKIFFLILGILTLLFLLFIIFILNQISRNP